MADPVRVAGAAKIPPGSGRVVEAMGRRIAVFNVAGRYHAIDDACPHQGGPLSDGALDGGTVTCPWHGARFDVTTGAVLGPPASDGVRHYPVRVAGPDLLLEMSAGAAESPGVGAGRTTLVLTATRPETPDVTSFLFRSEAPLSWQAGQFLHYILPHPEPDDRGIGRYFTIASAPFEGHVMLTTRFADGRSSTFKRALRALPIGARIEVDGPDGDFTVSDPTRPCVLIAGGIGITPFRAILLDLDHHRRPVSAVLLYANRTPDLVYRAELDVLCRRHPGLVLRPFVSPQRIDQDAISQAAPELGAADFLVSGPEPFVQTIGRLLSDRGVPEARLKRDYFPGYPWA